MQLRCSRSRSVGVAAPATLVSRIYALPAKAREWRSWGRRPQAVDAVRHPAIELSPNAGNVDLTLPAKMPRASNLAARGGPRTFPRPATGDRSVPCDLTKFHTEHGAAQRRLSDFDGPAVQLDGLPDNRQAEANSPRGAVSPAERTKQIF